MCFPTTACAYSIFSRPDVYKRQVALGLAVPFIKQAHVAHVDRGDAPGVVAPCLEKCVGAPHKLAGSIEMCIRDSGNTVVVVDHDTRVLAEADYLVEMGPVAGAGGGNVIAAGTVDEVERSQGSRIAPFLRADPKRCLLYTSRCV